VKIGVIATTSAASASVFVNPYSVQGVKAAAAAINATGGIGGSHLQVEVCDNAGDPNRDIACAQQAVRQEWVAVVGGYDVTAPQNVLPVLQAAQVPYLGQMQGTAAEFQSEVSFPVEVGTVGNSIGTAVMMVDSGCRNSVVVSYTSAPGATERLAQIKAALEKAGNSTARIIGMQTNLGDITPVVANALADEPDCLYFSGTGEDAAKLFTAVSKTSSGADVKLFVPTGVLRPDIIKALGPVADGIQGTSGVPLANNPDPSVQRYLKDLETYDPEATPTEQTLNGYAAVMLLAEVMDNNPRLNAQALLQKLKSTTAAKVMVFPALDFTLTRDSELYPRQPNTVVWFSTVKDGHWQSVNAEGTPTDISDYLP